MIRKIVLGLGVTGFLAFAAAFLLSLSDPVFVERIAREIIRQQVEHRVREKVHDLESGFLVSKARSLLRTHEQEAQVAQRWLTEHVPERVAGVVTEMADPSCECRQTVANWLTAGLKTRLAGLKLLDARLTQLVRTKYLETARQLTREFRIFTGANALVFLCLIAAVSVKRAAGLHLLPVAVVLFVSALVTAWLYLFNQNWLHAIVFGDYVGRAYLGYLALVFSLLSDLAFNRARVSTRLLNGILSLVGSAASIAPC